MKNCSRTNPYFEVSVDTATRVQIQDGADCISRCTNTLGNGMNRVILPLAMGRIVGLTGFFNLS